LTTKEIEDGNNRMYGSSDDDVLARTGSPDGGIGSDRVFDGSGEDTRAVKIRRRGFFLSAFKRPQDAGANVPIAEILTRPAGRGWSASRPRAAPEQGTVREWGLSGRVLAHRNVRCLAWRFEQFASHVT